MTTIPATQTQPLVVVAMSGGVDSCAAALLLADQGYSVVGVSMQVWDYRRHQGNAKRATCCAPADFDDARNVADLGGFPFYVFDFEDSFYAGVIRPFIDSYLQGLTPNPCLDCNRKVKFRELRNRARSFGTKLVATGHYARIRERNDGTFGLFTARDLTKDQSYFLYALTPDDLRETIFPVGEMIKTDVRAYLDSRKVRVASKPESQDICFVSTTAGEFVERESKTGRRPGEIVSADGKKLGEHDGVHHFTVGQRRGLGVSASEKLYVLNIDAKTNRVEVGHRDELEQSGFELDEVNWISGKLPEGPVRARVKMRYRHEGVLADIFPVEGDKARVEFVEEWSTISPGQAAVFYRVEAEADGAVEVLGGGIIRKR